MSDGTRLSRYEVTTEQPPSWTAWQVSAMGSPVRRSDLAQLRHRGLTEWVVAEAIVVNPVPCVIETDLQLPLISTLVTSELSGLLRVGLDQLYCLERVGRVYTIAFVGQQLPALPWLVGAPAGLAPLLDAQRDLARNLGTHLRLHSTWPGPATPEQLRRLIVSGGGALDLLREELAYWLLKLQMLSAHVAASAQPCACHWDA